MKLQFKHQQYQTDAADAITRVFSGQSKGHRKETVSRDKTIVDEIFSNKKIEIGEHEILKNVQELQKEQGIDVSQKLEGLNFTVEMETGTGKTYVYTKAMFELNRQYGWNKFIIMVPSIAIREGVHKSLEITAEHFQEEYGKKIRFFIYDTKNKSNLVNIKSYANTSNIEVIIMNHQAFATKSKESKKIYQKLDQIQSEKPIDILKRARPILIIDEPQRFGLRAKAMLKEFNPLFITRFSATHKKDYNKIYRLDAIDAYNQKLVKKIKVKGIEVKGGAGADSYIFLDRINISSNAYPTATLEFEVRQANSIKKTSRTFKEGDSLFSASGDMAQYEGYVIREINGLKNTISFTGGVSLSVGQVVGAVEEKHVRTIQIREAIKSHIEKERELFKRGIKVLTLFFIDEVAKYRAYDDKGNSIRSEYEEIFEREYEHAIAQRDLLDTEYNTYLDSFKTSTVHNGYFSIDKKGKAINSKESRGGGGSDDVSAYDLIMKKKEILLDLKEPTRFIFSHSALREGWDNPNIFQICTLKQSSAHDMKRQEIGRGLRIAVDGNGDRMDHSVLENEFFDVNTLTVVASESYDTFAKQLQKEIFDSLSGRPTKLEVSALVGRLLENSQGNTTELQDREVRHLINSFEKDGYIDDQDCLTQKFVEDYEADKVEVPEILIPFKAEVLEIVFKIHSTNTFKASENDLATNINEHELKPNENFAKKEFQELWNRVKIKTVYDVSFETDELIDHCVKAIDSELQVSHTTIRVTTGDQVDDLTEENLRQGESFTNIDKQVVETESILGNTKYDLLAEIAKEACITRKTVAEILSKINVDKFHQFQVNPEHFIREVVRLINEQKASTLINNITYHKTDQVYENDVFTMNNFKGSLGRNILEVKNHIYKYVKTDSDIERKFVGELDIHDKVLVYAKLPSGFKIPTPLGNYNPDWAIVFDDTDVKYIYFIAETKGSMSSLQLKGVEEGKIAYARKHFESLGHQDLKYDVVDTFESLLSKVMI